MKRFTTLFVALGLATAGSTALAEQTKEQVSKQQSNPQPVQMTEAQLDNVAAGVAIAIFDVVELENVLNNANIAVAVPVNVGANVGVLSGPQLASAGQRLVGRQTQ